MKTKTLIQTGAIIVMLLFTGCNRVRNDSSRDSQPLTAATSVSASNETATTVPTEIMPSQAVGSAQPETAATPPAVDSPTQPEVTPTPSIVATNVAQATDDLDKALDKALDDLNSTDELNDLP